MFHKDMLTKTDDDNDDDDYDNGAEEVAKASKESEMLLAAASAELPPRARFEGVETLPQGARCDSQDAGMWPDITGALLMNLERIRDEPASYASLQPDVGIDALQWGGDLG